MGSCPVLMGRDAAVATHPAGQRNLQCEDTAGALPLPGRPHRQLSLPGCFSASIFQFAPQNARTCVERRGRAAAIAPRSLVTTCTQTHPVLLLSLRPCSIADQL